MGNSCSKTIQIFENIDLKDIERDVEGVASVLAKYYDLYNQLDSSSKKKYDIAAGLLFKQVKSPFDPENSQVGSSP